MKRKSILATGWVSGTALSVGTTYYSTLAFNRSAATTTEAEREVPLRMNGTFKKLVVDEPFNSLTTANAVVTLRKNGSGTALTVTVPPSGASVYEIEADVSFTDTDTFSIEVAIDAGGSGSFYPYKVYCVFENDLDETYQWFERTTGNPGISTASVTRVSGMGGSANTGTVYAETGANRNALLDITASNFTTSVTANGRSSSTTFRSRKNIANGNCVNTFGAGVTGIIEDTADTDTYTALTDLYCQNFTTGTGASNINIGLSGVMMTSADGAQMSSQDNQNVIGRTSSATPDFYPLCGALPAGNTDFDRCAISAPFPMRITGLESRCTSFSAGSNVTLGVYVNGVLSSLYVEFSGVGDFMATGSVDLEEGDRFCVGLVDGTSGSINFGRVVISYEDTTPAPPVAAGTTFPRSRLSLGLGLGLMRV